MSQEPAKPVAPIDERDIVNPIARTLSTDSKADELCALSIKNQPEIERFISNIDGKYKTKSTSDCKQKQRIIGKASRPSILKKKPWFDVEHVRDGLRFRTALEDFRELPKIISDLKAAGYTVVKAETIKMLAPLSWGWRAVMYDIQLPDGQLVEYYLTVKELMDANDNVHHALYEKWRNCSKEEISARIEEFNADQVTSNEAFDGALEAYLKRTDQTDKTIRDVLAEADKITG